MNKPAHAARYLLFPLLLFMLLFLRRPQALLNPQFWAEDGSVFFTEQLIHGLWASLGTEYAGYLHTVPRLVAALATLLPAHLAPLAFAVSALAIDAVCCSLFALPYYRYLVRSDALRVLLCLFVAAGLAADELVGILTNVQWYLILAMLLMLLLPDDVPRPVLYFAAAFCLLVALSAPLGVLLSPIAAAKIWRTRSRLAWPAAALLVGAAAQILVMLLVPDPSRDAQIPRLSQLVRATVNAFDYRVVMWSMAGRSLTDDAWLGDRGIAGFLILAAMTVWVVALFKSGDRRRRWELAICVYLTFGCMVPALALRGITPLFASRGYLHPGNERYFLLGACCLAYLLAVSLERWMARVRPAVRTAILALLLAGGFVGNFRIPPLPDAGWREAGAAVDRWVSDMRAQRSTARLEIGINPPGWVVILPAGEK